MLKIIVVASLGAVGCLHDGVHHGTTHHGYSHGYSTPVVVQPQPQPTYVDTQGRPVYADANGQPVYDDGQPVDPASIVRSQGTVTPTVVVPPVIYDHHDSHHDTHHDDHH